jgi:ribosome-associated protein
MDAKSLAYRIAELAEDKKATDVEILDMRKLADITDYVLIASANNTAQLKAISRHIEEALSELGLEPGHKEGNYGDKWFLLDYVDVVVHIIHDEARNFYNLEELWSQAVFLPRLMG